LGPPPKKEKESQKKLRAFELLLIPIGARKEYGEAGWIDKMVGS
jgi:hypothetical protein